MSIESHWCRVHSSSQQIPFQASLFPLSASMQTLTGTGHVHVLAEKQPSSYKTHEILIHKMTLYVFLTFFQIFQFYMVIQNNVIFFLLTVKITSCSKSPTLFDFDILNLSTLRLNQQKTQRQLTVYGCYKHSRLYRRIRKEKGLWRCVSVRNNHNS